MKKLELVKKNTTTKSKDKAKKKEENITADQLIKDVGIDIEALNALATMYKLRSYTGYEDPMRKYIIEQLDLLNIPYVLYNGNIVGINHERAPLLSAHMDMVNTDSYIIDKNKEYNYEFTIDTKYNIRIFRTNDTGYRSQTSLGADDKNGIWLILELLKKGKKVNFVFSHGEEGGCVGISQVVSNEKIAKAIEKYTTYSLVIDRRNSSDIIGYGNSYCVALDDKLETFAKNNGYKFKKANGLCSDANHISKLVECVNLSAGYYQAHSSSEFTNIMELYNTYKFVDLVIDNFNYESVSADRMREFKKCSKPYRAEVQAQSTPSTSVYDPKKYRMQSTGWFKTYDEIDKEEDDEDDSPAEIAVMAKERCTIEAPTDILDTGICPMCEEQVYVSQIDNDITSSDYNQRYMIGDLSYICYECGGEFDHLLDKKGTPKKVPSRYLY